MNNYDSQFSYMGLLIKVDDFNTELVVSLLGSVKKVRVYKDMK